VTLARFGWWSGLLLIALSSMVTVGAVTFPSRASLLDLEGQAKDLAEREASLMERMTTLLAAESSRIAIPPENVWKSNATGTTVELALQEALVAAAGASGMQLVSFSEAAPISETSLPTIAYELELTGNHEGLARFLAVVETVSPPLSVSYIWLRQLPPNQSQPGAPLTVRLTTWGFLESEADE